MNKISILALACCALLLASCGKKHEAKSTVKEFISANFTDNDYSIESYTDIDSTNYVTPEAIKLMRQNMAQSNAYKKDSQNEPDCEKCCTRANSADCNAVCATY